MLEPAIRGFASERPMLAMLFDVWCGDAAPEEMEALVHRISPGSTLRTHALHAQLLVEMNVRAGRPDAALRGIEEVGSTMLIDLEWLTMCEALDPIRAAIPDSVRAAVAQRAAQIWRV